jgi:hypothetical protein
MRLFAMLLMFSLAGFSQSPSTSASAMIEEDSAAADKYNYRLLATNKTSTMQKEMNEAAEAGYRFGGVSGGATAFGGDETVVIMRRDAGYKTDRFEYQLLATQKTSTMQKELQQAGDEGYEYKGQAVFDTAAGGREVVVILELDREEKRKARYNYLLLATQKTSTMQKELKEAGAKGYEFVGVTVGETAFGGHEVVSILRKKE